MKALRTAAIFLGLSMEYYDFMIYLLMGTYLTQIFFPSDILSVSMVYFFFTALTASLGKMLGSIFLGYLCDKIGVKFSLSYSIILMGFLSIAIGLLSTDAEYLAISAILLIIIRFLQGAIYSVEIPSSLVYIQTKKNNALYGTLFSSLSFGYILASFVVYLVSTFYTPEMIKEFAWRIPFLFGGTTCILGFILRYAVMIDVPSNIDYKKRMIDLFQMEYLMTCLKIIALYSVPALIMINGISCMTILNKTFNIVFADIMKVNTIAVIFSIIISPFIGKYLSSLRKLFLPISLISASIYWFIYYDLTISTDGYKLVTFFFGYQLVLSFYYVHVIERVASFTAHLEHKTTIIAVSQSLAFAIMHLVHIGILESGFSLNYVIACLIVFYGTLCVFLQSLKIENFKPIHQD